MTKEEFQEKWDNYWYHYKLHTWVAIFVVFCIAFTVMEVATRKPSDFDITYIGDYMDHEGLANAISEKYGEDIGDINNDGQIKIEVNNIYTSENVAYDTDLDLWQRVDMDLVNGESYIYLIDEQLLEGFVERGANGVIKTKDGYAPYIDVSQNEFLKDYLPQDKKVYMCVRQYFQQGTDDKIKMVEEKSLELIEKILEK